MRLPAWLADYGRRFTPFLAAKLAQADLRRIPATVNIPKNVLDNQLQSALNCLNENFPAIDFNQSISIECIEKAERILEAHLGFRLKTKKSTLPDCGNGVFVDSGKVPPGQIVAVYPGTIYDPWDSILLQSIGNHFVLRCQDGTTVDGNDRRLSRRVHLSCLRRDLSPSISDITWLNERPFNFLNMGQYINNGSSVHNVQYVDLNILNWRHELRKLLPYAVYAAGRQLPLRVVVLVSTREILEGEELFSAYISK